MKGKIYNNLIDFLTKEGYLQGYNIIPKDTSPKGHGGCCYCQDCGYGHDECICEHNFLLENIRRIFREES